jgi:hypothetical protein
MRSNAEIEAYKREAGLRMLAVGLELLFPDLAERQKQYKRIERAAGSIKPKLVMVAAAGSNDEYLNRTRGR